jgi:ribosome-associated protein YbcJ (S4-like RNA binding protein)
MRVAAGEVRVNGEVCTQRGKKLRGGDRVALGPEEYTVKQA